MTTAEEVKGTLQWLRHLHITLDLRTVITLHDESFTGDFKPLR